MNNEMKVTVQAKGRYGTWFYYPVCEKAEQFRQIEGGKTLTAQLALNDALGAVLASGLNNELTFVEGSAGATTTKITVNQNVGSDNKFSVVAEGVVLS